LATATGANAQAVAEYAACCLAALQKQHLLHDKKIAGVIGCGRIGRLVAAIFQTLGYEVISSDPLLNEKPDFNFVSLDVLLRESDIISIHTPLTKNGLHPTFHLINDEQIKKIKPNAILINTARGSVIDQSALLNAKNIILCFDVWEHEPHISLELLHKVIIGTPHIAGYSVQAKYRATQMVYERAAEFFGWEKIVAQENTISIDRLLLSAYDPLEHTKQFRRAFQNQTDPEIIQKIFIAERKKYPLRTDFHVCAGAGIGVLKTGAGIGGAAVDASVGGT